MHSWIDLSQTFVIAEMDKYFPENYCEGRKLFRAACERNDLKIDSHTHPEVRGPNGEDLAIDCVWIGPVRAQRVLLLLCGTHGLEAGPGAATILQWMDSGALQNLSEGTAVMIIYGVNPYGWAYSSRTNEDNIDLNRNFLDHTCEYPPNSGYAEVHSHILTDDISNTGLESALGHFHRFAEQHGDTAALQAITAGQFENPEGLGFGGRNLSWSVTLVQKLIKTHFTHAKKVIAIDWHTGIGHYAEPFIILEDDVGSDMHTRASQVWGADYIHADDIFEGTKKPDYIGLVMNGLKNQISISCGANVLGVVIEWGTYGLDSMLQALFMDNWLRTKAEDPDSTDVLVLKERLKERFYPSQPEWRQSILAHSARIYTQTLSALKEW